MIHLNVKLDVFSEEGIITALVGCNFLSIKSGRQIDVKLGSKLASAFGVIFTELAISESSQKESILQVCRELISKVADNNQLNAIEKGTSHCLVVFNFKKQRLLLSLQLQDMVVPPNTSSNEKDDQYDVLKARLRNMRRLSAKLQPTQNTELTTSSSLDIVKEGIEIVGILFLLCLIIYLLTMLIFTLYKQLLTQQAITDIRTTWLFKKHQFSNLRTI